MDGDDGLFTASLTSQPSFILFSAGTLRMPDSGYITLPADGAYLVEVSSSPSEPVPGNGSFVLSVLEAPVGSCDFTVSTNGHNFTRDGGRGNLIVGANNGSCAWTAISTASWIKLMAPGGNGSGALEYSVEPNTGAFRTGAIVIAGRQLLVSQQPANALVAVSSADYTSNLANGAIQTIFGSGLAPQTIAAPTLPLPTTLGGAEVVVTTNSRASYNAPLFFVSPTQINFLMPYFLPGAVDITVKLNGQITGATRAVVGNLAPGLFTIDSSGRGLPAAYVLRARRDGTQTTEPIFNRDATGAIIPRPIRLADDENVFLILYGTGLNGVQLAGSEVEATFQDGITQKGQLFAAPGFSGLDQINLLLPLSLRGRGDVTLTIKRDGFVSNPVTIRIGGQ